jgi:hypothetical protein
MIYENYCVKELCSVEVEVSGVKLRIYSYRIVECSPAEPWWLELDPLRFLAHQFAPIFNMITAITLKFATAPPEDATLALVPSEEHIITTPITVTLVCATHQLLRALASHPVHFRVFLCLESQYVNGISAPDMNDHLWEFRNSVHLKVPYNLLTLTTAKSHVLVIRLLGR